MASFLTSKNVQDGHPKDVQAPHPTDVEAHDTLMVWLYLLQACPIPFLYSHLTAISGSGGGSLLFDFGVLGLP